MLSVRCLSLLNLISLEELGALCYLRWDSCFRYFSETSYKRADIKDIFKILKDARNPYAHSNAQLLSPAEIDQVNEICDKLVRSIEKEEKRQYNRTQDMI